LLRAARFGRHAGEGIEKQRKEEKSGGASVREEVSVLDR
jgi:hypothetical protein